MATPKALVASAHQPQTPGSRDGMSQIYSAAQIERIARVCHEANRGYQLAFPSEGIPVALPWDEFCYVHPDQADGVCEGVRMALDGATPEDLHKSWVHAKVVDGWCYGPVKDSHARTHPCLVDDYKQLPAEQRTKDTLFAAIVGALKWI